jgi:hypothetical protein
MYQHFGQFQGLRMGAYSRFLRTFATMKDKYSDPKSFVNFLLPPREFGEGWSGVKNLRLLQGLLYRKKPGFISQRA